MRRILLGGVLIPSVLVSTQVFALDVQVGDVQDSRTTGQFFAGLTVDLKLVGDELGDAEGIKVRLESAIDDTGRDLLKPDESSDRFEDVRQFGQTINKVSVKLKNPSRKAEKVKELKGAIELFVPKKDPAARYVVNDLSKEGGKPLAAPIFKENGVELTLLSPAQVKLDQKAETEKRIADARAQGLSEDMIKMMSEAASFSFGGSDENSLTMRVNDPKGRIVSVNVIGADGKKLDSNGSMSSGNSKTLFFQSAVPANAKVEVTLATPKALVAVPIALQNVALP